VFLDETILPELISILTPTLSLVLVKYLVLWQSGISLTMELTYVPC